jgi:hypothetical protein
MFSDLIPKKCLLVGVDAALFDCIPPKPPAESRLKHGLLFNKPTFSFERDGSVSALESMLRFLRRENNLRMALLLPVTSPTGVTRELPVISICSDLLRSASSCSRFNSANLRNII